MKTSSHKYAKGLTVLLLTLLFACSPANQPPEKRESQMQGTEQIKASASAGSSADRAGNSSATNVSDPNSLPVRFQNPSFAIAANEQLSDEFGEGDDFVVMVGADISSTTGPVKLRDIMKKLAALKKMKISWASDVDQNVMVDVDIRANDDFFKSIDALLRQRDYFHEVDGNAIVIKYKDTKRFHLAIPFVASKYQRSVGSDISANTSMSVKTIQDGDETEHNVFDVWASVQLNLDKILQVWSVRTSLEQTGKEEGDKTGTVSLEGGAATETSGDTSAEKKATAAEATSTQQAGLGFYTIDKPVGIITVTAPRYQLIKVENYITHLKKELYRQINIEAKILEVKISGSRKVGIDWNSLLDEGIFTGSIGLGSSTATQPFGSSGARSFTILAPSFNMLVSAIEKQGRTKVVSNPKISVLNGQPAMINVGTNQTYIKDVSQTVDEGVVTYTINTAETSSGIVLSVVASIMDNDEIILNMTPVTSLVESLTYESFGTARVGLPVVKVKEMTTIVKIKSGEMLVVGGLIDLTSKDDNEGVPLLRRLPFINKLFSLEDKSKTTTELVILLRPEIIS